MKETFRGIIATLILSTVFLAPTHVARADVWGSNYASAIGKQMMEEISTQLRESIAASAKLAAIQQVIQTIQDTLAQGGQNSPRYIRNYEDFLYGQPQQKSELFVENFLTGLTQGRTTGNYIPAGTSGGEGVSQSYTDYLYETGLASVGMSAATGGGASAVDECDFSGEGSPLLFGTSDTPNFRCFSAFFADPGSNPIGVSLMTQAAYQQELQRQQQVAYAQAVNSGGFLPAMDDNGNIKTPAPLIEEAAISQISVPLASLANSDSNAFSLIAQAFVAQMITKVIEQGTDGTQSAYQNSLNSFSQNTTDQYNTLREEDGPGLPWQQKGLYQ